MGPAHAPHGAGEVHRTGRASHPRSRDARRRHRPGGLSMTTSTETTGVQIVLAAAVDAPLVAGLIATAFHDLEAARWQIPDEHQRRAILPAIFQEYVHHAIEHGNVEVSADMTAVAVWTVET